MEKPGPNADQAEWVAYIDEIVDANTAKARADAERLLEEARESIMNAAGPAVRAALEAETEDPDLLD